MISKTTLLGHMWELLETYVLGHMWNLLKHMLL